MALKATIFKVALNVSDMDRHVYESFSLTVARHPSETDERMMTRIVAFALNANNDLGFTKGLSADDEPEIWQKSLSGEIENWIEIGLPGEERLRKACNRSRNVLVYAYGTDRNMTLWWNKIANKLSRFDNLKVLGIAEDVTQVFADFVKPAMSLQCMIEDGELWLSDENNNIQIIPKIISPVE